MASALRDYSFEDYEGTPSSLSEVETFYDIQGFGSPTFEADLRSWRDVFDEASAAIAGASVVSEFLKFHVQRPANRDDPHFEAIECRVGRLRILAKAEQMDFSEVSAKLLLRFCHELASDIKPAIFALLNGNLRAIWENSHQEQIGIQFLPDGMLQYVMFRQCGEKLMPTMGKEMDSLGLEQRVDDLGLGHLWFCGKE